MLRRAFQLLHIFRVHNTNYINHRVNILLFSSGRIREKSIIKYIFIIFIFFFLCVIVRLRVKTILSVKYRKFILRFLFLFFYTWSVVILIKLNYHQILFDIIWNDAHFFFFLIFRSYWNYVFHQNNIIIVIKINICFSTIQVHRFETLHNLTSYELLWSLTIIVGFEFMNIIMIFFVGSSVLCTYLLFIIFYFSLLTTPAFWDSILQIIYYFKRRNLLFDTIIFK